MSIVEQNPFSREPSKRPVSEKRKRIFTIPGEYERFYANRDKERAKIVEQSFAPRLDDAEANNIIETRIDVERLTHEVGPPFDKAVVIRDFARLVLEIKDELPQYDAIISDEASARVVALLIHQLAKKLAHGGDKRGGEHDAPSLHFLNLGRSYGAKTTLGFIRKMQDDGKFRHALIVSEHISMGMTTPQWSKMFNDIGFKPDWAVLQIGEHLKSQFAQVYLDEFDEFYDNEYVQRHDREFFKRLHYGGIGGWLYGHRSGAMKINPEIESHESWKETYDQLTDRTSSSDFNAYRSAFPIRDPNISKEQIRKERQDITKIADALFKLLT